MLVKKFSKFVGLLSVLVSLVFTAAPPVAAEEEPWKPLGLLRIRDMTPFGMQRLDLLPTHAIPAKEGTWAIETNLSYQNTYALSENVQDYLKARGKGRAPLSDADVDAIMALPGDAYLVDGEFGLVDLTVHHRFSSHWGAYATVPYYYFDGGFLDTSIEGVHEGISVSTAGRDLVARDQFQFAAHIGETSFRTLEAPEGGEFGDPVLGARYSLKDKPSKWNLIFEAAAKISVRNENTFVSSGHSDYGGQLTVQRFLRKQAVYVSFSGVYFNTFDERLTGDKFIPTLIVGYEHRLTRHTNGILQFYASPSVIQNSNAAELTDDKFQLTLGLQRLYRNNILRFGVTENLSNFNNTPDIGISLSLARIFPGKG